MALFPARKLRPRIVSHNGISGLVFVSVHYMADEAFDLEHYRLYSIQILGMDPVAVDKNIKAIEDQKLIPIVLILEVLSPEHGIKRYVGQKTGYMVPRDNHHLVLEKIIDSYLSSDIDEDEEVGKALGR